MSASGSGQPEDVSAGVRDEMTAPTSRPSSPRFRMHWHVVLVHFPVSAFSGAFLFMGLHVLTGNPCLTLAAFITLVASALVLIPTVITGWRTWKRTYKGSKNKLFLVKIWTASAMVPLSVGLVWFQSAHPFERLDIAHDVPHLVYFAGVGLLMIGAFIEGYWGGRLHHR